MYIQIRYGDII